ncbi:MAG TPA: hypothetical protein VGO52_20240 [Hyphomonadaceae bacterium]|nr:hypothetical protein [Hyphomonadaceae bacterium]
MARAVVEGAESVPNTTVRLRRIPELEEARKALSAQDAYVRAQQAQAEIPEVTHDDLRWARAVQRSIHDAHGEDCFDAAEGEAMPRICDIAHIIEAQDVGGE